MTAGAGRRPPAGTVAFGDELPARARPTGPRLLLLYLVSRRVPTALAAVATCAVVLRVALHWPWDAYGALQLPLVCEAGAAAAIAVTAASPFGGPERVAGRWLPFLRLAVALALTAVAVAALAAAGATTTHLAGGILDVLRNVAGLAGLGLLSAAVLSGALAWTGPVAYLVLAVYGLYTDWHGPALTTPWLWPARPPHDLGAALCAGLVFAAGIAVITVRGARDVAGDRG